MMSHYSDFMKESMVIVEETNNRYEKDFYVEYYTEEEKKEIREKRDIERKKEKERIRKIIKEETLELQNKRIKKLKKLIKKERYKNIEHSHKIALNYKEYIEELEKEMVGEDDEWMLIHITKEISETKQGLYGKRLKRELSFKTKL